MDNGASNKVAKDKVHKPNLQSKLTEIMTSLQLDDAPAGGSVVVYHKGQLIAQASFGQANPNLKWDVNTQALNFSTGKSVLVTLVHILVSNKLIDYDQSIASYWPEFAQNGKDKITLRDVLSHSTNLFNIQSITKLECDIFDWQLMLNRVANMSPESPKNTQAQSAYSALVSGWVLGGLIEKVTGKALNEVLDSYLAQPLGVIGQLSFGINGDNFGKVATLTKNFANFKPQMDTAKRLATTEDDLTLTHADTAKRRSGKPKLRVDTQHIREAYQSLPSYQCWLRSSASNTNKVDSSLNDSGLKSSDLNNSDLNSSNLTTMDIVQLYLDMSEINLQDFKNSLIPTNGINIDYYSPQALMAKIPAVNNIASADALAKMYAMLANRGKWGEEQLITPEVFEQLQRIHVTGSDAIMPASHPNSMQWRLGYHRIFSRCQPDENLKNAFGHMGYNGSVAWCDVEKQLAVVYVHNYDVTMSTDIRQFAINEAILEWLN